MLGMSHHLRLSSRGTLRNPPARKGGQMLRKYSDDSVVMSAVVLAMVATRARRRSRDATNVQAKSPHRPRGRFDRHGFRGLGSRVRSVPCERSRMHNYSKGGRSSGSFIKEGSWQKVLDDKPDYVLIQFGHNDQPGHGADRETDPQTTYKQNMTRYVDEARAAGIKPVLVTSLSRRQWGSDHHIHSTLEPYAEAVKEIAAEKNVPLIDLHWRSIEVYESLREEACKIISPPKDGGYDGTHLNKYGGDLFGSLVAAELRTTVPELNRYIRGFGQNAAHPPTTAPTTAPSCNGMHRPSLPTPKGATQITVAEDGSGDVRNRAGSNRRRRGQQCRSHHDPHQARAIFRADRCSQIQAERHLR